MEGHSPIWPIRLCATEQGMVSRVSSLKQGIYNSTIERLEQGVSLDHKRLTGCEFWRCVVYVCDCSFFFFN